MTFPTQAHPWGDGDLAEIGEGEPLPHSWPADEVLVAKLGTHVLVGRIVLPALALPLGERVLALLN